MGGGGGEACEEGQGRRGQTCFQVLRSETRCSKEEQSKRENLQGQQEKEQAGQGQGQGQGEEQQEQEQEVSRSPAPPQQRRKRKEVLHGAMDDFMAEKEPPRGDGASIVAPSNRPPRGKRRRLVEKVSAWWWSRFRSLSALSPHM